MKKQFNSKFFAENLAAYYEDNPAVTFRVAWAAYVNNLIPLSEAAAAVGGTFKQFLELGKHYTKNIQVDISELLLTNATSDEEFLIRCLPQRLINVLEQLLVKDILLPMSNRYIGTLWEDMRLLKRLKLVRETKRTDLYQYSLNLNNRMK